MVLTLTCFKTLFNKRNVDAEMTTDVNKSFIITKDIRTT